MGEPGAHRIMLLQGKYVRFVLQPADWCAEDDPAEILFEFSPIAV